MDYRPRSYYKKAAEPAKPVLPPEADYNVYFRDNEGKLGQMNVNANDAPDHAEAILLVQEGLVASGEGWNAPVLVSIKGGKANEQ